MNLRDLYYYAFEFERLISVTIELNKTCNFDCIHCYIPEHNDMGLSTSVVKKIILEAHQLGALNITFTGGEVLLRSDFLELVSYTRSLRMRVFILSNASLLTEEKVMMLSALHIAEFSTTLFSMNEHINDSITKVKNSFSRVITGLMLLKKHGVRTMVKTPVMKINMNEYKDVELFAQQNGFRFTMSPTIITKTDGNSQPVCLSVPNIDLDKIIDDFDRIDRKEDPIIVDAEIPCHALFYSLFVSSHGDYYPCNTMPIKLGSVQDNTIQDIWTKSPELKRLRLIRNKDLTECNVCNLRSRCFRCPALALLEDGNIMGCSSASKRLALARSIKKGPQL